MSDTYIPELIELNSYWQNAVEEAIQDTLKGEKRLYYALKNRKKIKQKLEKLGVNYKTPRTGMKDGRLHMSHGECYSGTLPSYPRSSFISEEFSHIITDPKRSRSRSGTRGETPQKYRNPERPLLGDGSLEKMKKSQNDFNYEPMGEHGGEKLNCSISELEKEEEEEEEEEEDDDDEEEEEVSDRRMRVPGCDFKNSSTKVQWIHVRENSNFGDSDTETSHTAAKKITLEDMIVKKELNSVMNCNKGNVSENSQKIPINFDPRGDLFWENEVKNAIRANANFERKLQLALAKREILNDHQAIQRIEEDEDEIEIKESFAKNMEKRKRGKKFLSPFVRFYLEVYRELCLKCPMKQIAEEAAKRWWDMKTKQKSDYSARKSRK